LRGNFSQRLIKLFFSFFENGIFLKPNRHFIQGLLNFIESDPMKTLNNSIFQMKYSQKFVAEIIQGSSFKNFLRDYNKIDFNPTTRFKNILNKIEFENSKKKKKKKKKKIKGYGKNVKSKEFIMKFEVPDYLFLNFGKTVISAGQSWNAEHLKKIERIVDETIDDQTNNNSINASISNNEKKSFWTGKNNLILFIKSFFNKHFENYQDDLIKRAKHINFDLVIRKDFENWEKGKKPLMMTLPHKNLAHNPYYFLNKALFLFYFQQRKAKEFIIQSKSLLNV